MTDWKEKYKDLEVGKFVWYWHNLNQSSTKSQWESIRVLRYISMQDGYPVLVAYDICGNQTTVSENYPNGPKCITPDEVIEITQKLTKINKIVKEKSMYELGREKALEAKKKKYPRDIPPGFDPDTDSLYGGSKKR